MSAVVKAPPINGSGGAGRRLSPVTVPDFLAARCAASV